MQHDADFAGLQAASHDGDRQEIPAEGFGLRSAHDHWIDPGRAGNECSPHDGRPSSKGTPMGNWTRRSAISSATASYFAPKKA